MYYIFCKGSLYYSYMSFDNIYECYTFITYIVDNKIDIWFRLSVDLSDLYHGVLTDYHILYYSDRKLHGYANVRLK